MTDSIMLYCGANLPLTVRFFSLRWSLKKKSDMFDFMEGARHPPEKLMTKNRKRSNKMKLASFFYQGQECLGVAAGENEIIDLALALAPQTTVPRTMLELIDSGAEGLEFAARALKTDNPQARIPCDRIIWRPPVPKPGKICGVALNNSASNDRKISAPDHPAFFIKPASCLVGHGRPLTMRSYYGSMHPEPELAVVIGKMTRDVDAIHALSHVYGYSIFNDITGNGMRAEDLFHYWALYADENDPGMLVRREQHLSYAGRYKGTDCFGVLGPWLVTPDEAGDPDNLAVSCRVAGEIVAEDSTSFYNYKVAEIISYISQFHTLSEGDIISCGTAFKPAVGRKSIHHANLLKTGGPVQISIENLGTQENPVIVEEREIGKWKLP
jgi:2,4-didehydro-3-deoxy-L-rhamnonate hydrolase